MKTERKKEINTSRYK